MMATEAYEENVEGEEDLGDWVNPEYPQLTADYYLEGRGFRNHGLYEWTEERQVIHSRGACVTSPLDFFPDKNASQRPQKNLCLFYCPVVFDCLVLAIRENEKFGIWGGANPRDREAAKKRVVRKCSSENRPIVAAFSYLTAQEKKHNMELGVDLVEEFEKWRERARSD